LPGRSRRPHGWPPARPGSPFLITEFTALWAAQFLSSASDQLIQIAVAAGVYQQTGSPLAAALAYAVSYAALLTGGPLLAEVAGLAARRSLLITLAAGRAVLAALLATAGLPLAGNCALLVTVLLLGGSFGAARAAELPEVLPAGRLAAGIAASSVSGRAGQALGFLAGGVLLATAGPAAALVTAAGLLLAGAAVTAAWLRVRPVPHRRAPGRPLLLPVSRAEAIATLRYPVARSLLVFAWLGGCAVVPAALAGPYASELHAGPVAAGLLMAAVPAGALAGAATFALLVRPTARLQPLSWLAAVSSSLLTVVVMRPPLWLVGLAWAAAGAGAGYQAAAAMTVVHAVPATGWARAADLAEYGTAATQALALAAAALGAPVVGPRAVIAVTGLAGLAIGTALGRGWHRRTGHYKPQQPQPAQASPHDHGFIP
jgi:MFS transporter